MCRLLCLVLAALPACAQRAGDPPNIVWILSEDQSDHFGPYGETLAKTPHIDKLAADGALFTHAFVTAPVCSPSRSALVTGTYQTTIGAHNHRSGRGERKIDLPGEVEPVPAILRRAGYYVTNGSFRSDRAWARGKTDYNFIYPRDLYDGADWSARADGQPFFAQIQLRGGKRRNQRTLEPIEGVQTHGVSPQGRPAPALLSRPPQAARGLGAIPRINRERRLGGRTHLGPS